MNHFQQDPYYDTWNQKIVIHDCLLQLGEADMAKGVHTANFTGDIMRYVNLITQIAIKKKDEDVLNRLYFAGLIYG